MNAGAAKALAEGEEAAETSGEAAPASNWAATKPAKKAKKKEEEA